MSDIELNTHLVLQVQVECDKCSCIEIYELDATDTKPGEGTKFIDNIYDEWAATGCPSCGHIPDRTTNE